MFKIRDENFNIEFAYLDAFVDKDEKLLTFGLQIKAEGKENVFDSEEPHFNSEVLLKIEPNKIKKWKDIAGKIIQWKDYPDEEEEPHALFYVFEHEAVYNAKIEFENVDNQIFVKIKALCDINWTKKYSNNIPLEIETKVDFLGVLCGKDTSEKECKNEIKPYLDIDNLKYVQNKYGVSVLIPNDSNVETNLLVLGEY